MRYAVYDEKYHFRYAFDTKTGAYVRTGILDDKGHDTGVDPFMGSYKSKKKRVDCNTKRNGVWPRRK